MRTVRLGGADLTNMPLGSGGWAVGDSGWGPQDDDEPVGAIK